MFNFKLYEFASLYGMTYQFPQRGDGIGMHNHEQNQEHNVMVMRGSVQIYGPNREWCYTLRAGDIFNLDPVLHYPHEIVALEDDTSIMGMFVHGKPEGEHLSEEEKTGSFHRRPVTHPLPDDA